jgi:anti-sigma B factor antagonist
MLRNLKKLFGVENGSDEGDAVEVMPRRTSPRVFYDHPLITHSLIGQTLVITIVERELNITTAPDVCYEVKELFAREASVRHIVLDLENIKFVDSAGLNAMVELLSVVKKRQGRIGMAAATAHVEVLFKLTRLELVFTIRRTVIDAIDAIEPKG